MPFEEGNEFWKLRPTDGRKPIYETPEALEADCYEYLQHTASREGWNKQHWVGKDGDEVTINVPVPFTKSGLFVFLGISPNTWENYKKHDDFLSIITHIEQIIFTQKMEGAITGHFNANIISRDLGLVDKQGVSVNSEQPLFPDV